MNGPGTRAIAELQELVDDLVDADIPAAIDPKDVNVGENGAAWVTLEALRPRTLAGGWQADVAVFLVARDAGTNHAHADLADLLDAALTVLDPSEDVTTESLQLPGTSGLPAYRVPVQINF